MHKVAEVRIVIAPAKTFSRSRPATLNGATWMLRYPFSDSETHTTSAAAIDTMRSTVSKTSRMAAWACTLSASRDSLESSSRRPNWLTASLARSRNTVHACMTWASGSVTCPGAVASRALASTSA